MMNSKKTILALLCLIVAAGAHAIREYNVPTSNLPVPAVVSVSVPDGYSDLTSKNYPVVYLLNGHGGDNNSWNSFSNLDSLATVYQVIFVCPSGLNSWYFDSPVNSKMKMESYIVNDLVPWVDQNFSTIRDRSQRAITGLSMGGHGALWLAIRHSDIFGNAGSTSGGVDFRKWPDRWNLDEALGKYDSHAMNWNTHTVMSQVPMLTPGQINIIFDCGTEDFFFKVNKALDKALRARKIPHVFNTSKGAHTPSYWKKSIIPQLEFFSTKFKEAQTEE